ncbi:hypothetical protein HaLaN_15470 [Haematococcus lacustris]|uniref:Uncharacterized protein n=1 Tax=Haematococcus lacustris TaxID=44745 RepID=A0A699ZIG1_HAELA|nr:hypothetical protein HaLaN_15470 [Haematococcus lacustris]
MADTRSWMEVSPNPPARAFSHTTAKLFAPLGPGDAFSSEPFFPEERQLRQGSARPLLVGVPSVSRFASQLRMASWAAEVHSAAALLARLTVACQHVIAADSRLLSDLAGFKYRTPCSLLS